MKGQKKPLVPTKRWKKGNSCVTNPVSRKFREAAKKKRSSSAEFTAGQTSSLTCDTLMKHNVQMEEKLMDLSSNDDDTFSIGCHSIATSHASHCTNATFKRVIHNFSLSNVAAHKEVLAVLETVAEMIKEKSENDSDAKYLLALLHLIKSEKVAETGHTSPILYLLSLCVKRVPQPLLRMKFNEASQIILEALQANVGLDSISLVKSAVTILAALLRSLDLLAWKLENTRNIFFSILCLTDCEKHKVRKIAQHAVRAILNGSCFMLRDKAPLHHPAIQDTFEFCMKKLEERQSNDKSYLYVINLLGDILPIFPKSNLEKSCDTIIGLMSPTDAIANNDCLTALRKMFALRPKEDVLTAKFNTWIISELLKHQPTVQIETMGVWLLTTGRAYSNLSRTDPACFLNKLPDFFKTCFTIMSIQPVCTKQASEALMACISECTSSVLSAASEMSCLDDSPIHCLVKEMTSTYSMLFMGVMKTILKITDVFIKFFGKSCSNVLKKLLEPLNGLRCAEGFCKDLIMRIFATSIRTMGPKVFLEVLPLQITAENDDLEFPMSWILPLMRDNVQDTELKFFIDYFLPLLSKINLNLPKYESEAVRKTYEIITDQIWSLLPGFCTRPNDLKESFPKLAKMMASMLRSDYSENSRIDMLASLRKLCNSSLCKADEKATMERFARNYLPLLCSMYTGTQSGGEKEETLLSKAHNRAVLETFKVFLKVASENVIHSCISECTTRHNSQDLTTLQRHLLVDLITVLVQYMNSAVLEDVCKISKNYIENNEKSTQKKGYRLLQEICSMHPEFVSQQVDDMMKFIVDSFKFSNVATKVPRLHCITQLIKISQSGSTDFLRVVIPEAIMSVTFPGSKTKSAALTLTNELAKAYVRWNANDSHDASFKKFLVMLVAGLASSPPNVVRCTILTISEVLRVNTYMVNGEVLQIVVDDLITLMKSRAREILKSALILMKVLVSKYIDRLSLFIRPMVMSLVEMNERERHHLRYDAKEIYVKLVKKLGHQVLLEMMPERCHKIINHIRKELERTKKKKGENDESETGKTRDIEDDIENLLIGSEDDDDDDDEYDDMKSVINRKVKKPSEDMVFVENEEVTDFLDPCALKSISVKKGKKQAESGIQMRDGKLIIGEDDDYDSKGQRKRKCKTGDVSADDDDDMSQCTGISSSKRSRKILNRKRVRNDADDESVDDSRSNFTYKSGGTGIHRKNPSKQPVTKKQREEHGLEKKPKKQKGDATKGGMQPYSYIPLDKRMLNKRYRNKFKM